MTITAQAPSVEQTPSWMNQEAIDTLSRGYLLPGETPRAMWTRVTKAAAKILDRPEMEADFFEMFWRGYVGGATPVLSNMGSNRGLPISCLETGTRIHTKNGFKEIQDLTPGDLVLTHLGNWKPVLNVWSRQTDGDLYSLSISNRGGYELNITGNHPVLTNKGWVKVEDLNPSIHQICIEPLTDVFRKRSKRKTFEFKVGSQRYNQGSSQLNNSEFKVGSQRYNKGSSQLNNSGCFKVKEIPNVYLNAEVAWWLGLWFSEGHTSDNGTIGISMGWNEEHHLDEWLRIAEKYFDLKGTKDVYLNSRGHQHAQARIHNKYLSQFFDKEFGKGCKTKTIPGWFFEQPQDLLKSFAEGFIIGDGCIVDEGDGIDFSAISVGIANENLSYQLWYLFTLLGRFPSLSRKIASYHKNNNEQEDLNYENHGCFWTYLPKRIRSGKGLSRSFSVKKQTRETTVWDIEVDEDHSFIAQGVVVHNCYSTHISDSIHSIYSHLKEVAALSKHGGGVGVYLGDIRSAGSHISGGGKSTGIVPWARQYDYASQVVSQGGVRRGSFALYLPIDHPDLSELLRSKDHAMGDPRNFIDSQIAVTVEDKWIEEMIAGDREKQKLFGEVLKMRLVSGSPYIIFIDNANNQRPSSFAQRNLKISTSNLCFTGETMVAVADGRKPVPIKDLVDTRFPVYSARKAIYKEGWVTEIKPATAFSTGVREVVEVELEDGSTFRCTPDHLLATRNCDWVEAKDSVGKVIEPFTRFNNEFGHNMVNSVSNGRRRQSRMIWDYYNGDPGKGFQVDHIESQGGDNLDNLQLLTREEHLHKTSSERMGDNNPIHKVDSQFHSEYVSAAVTGKKNPRFNGIDNYQLIALGRMVYEEEGEFSKKQYLGLIEKGYNVPRSFSSYRFGGSFAEYTGYVVGNKEYNGEYDIEKEPPSNPRTVANETIKAKVKAIRNNGLKVVSIRPAGVETVYDLRVEDNHNFFIVTSQGEIESGVLVHNCSEIFLPTDENHTFVCVLSSLNLARWDEWKNWVGPNTGKTVPELMVYFLDAVVDEFIAKADRLPSMGRAVRFARKSRALGLGTMGLHALYQKHHLPFASEGARQLNVDIHKQIDELTLKASKAMAVEYGEPDWCQGDGIRHATRIAIAPTKSNSVICGAVSQGIEPIDSNYYVAKQAKGSFVRKNPYLEDHLKSIGYNTSEVWDSILDARGSVQHLHNILDDRAREVFKTAREIDQFEIIKQASDRQPHVCQGQSVNLFVDPESSAAYLIRLHLSAWKAKLKSLYYLKSTSLLVKKSGIKSTPTFTPVTKTATAVMYSKPDCPYCDKAKDVLDLHGYSIEQHHPDDWSNGHGPAKFPYKTVPQIWIGGEHIGGYDDLMVWLDSNPADTVYEECLACQG